MQSLFDRIDIKHIIQLWTFFCRSARISGSHSTAYSSP